MKRKLTTWVMLILLVMVLAACQSNQPSAASDPAAKQTAETGAYPAGEKAADEIAPSQDMGYPVSEEDLNLLIRTWFLSAVAENNQALAPDSREITFQANGTYEINSNEVVTTGTWTTQFTNGIASLILDPGSENSLMYEIADLKEDRLFLRSLQDGLQIDEQYLPAD